MNTEIIIALIGIIATGCSSFFTWLFTRKKYNAEVDSQVIRNMKDLLDFYIKLSDDTNRRVKEVEEEGNALRRKIEELNIKLMKI